MRTIKHGILVALALLTLAGLAAKASLIQATDPNFGPDSLTIDTATGLDWLDLTASAGLSYQQVLAGTRPGGIYSGFRFATTPEVLGLYSDAGIPGPGYYSLSTRSVQSLISLLGPTGSINGLQGLIGLSATPSNGDQNAPAIYAVGNNGTEVYMVSGEGAGFLGGTDYGVTFSYPDIGSWLVTNVPEPSEAGIYALAAASLIGFRYFLRWHKADLRFQNR